MRIRTSGRGKLPENVLAARRARIEGLDAIKEEGAAIKKTIEEEEKQLEETPIETFWHAKDTMNDPEPYLGPDTEEGRAERMGVWHPDSLKKLTRKPEAASRESQVFRLKAAHRICNLISQGQTLQQICGKDGLPSIMVVNRWLQTNERFIRMYHHARLIQADYLADEMLVLASLVRQQPKMAHAYKVAAEILKWQATVRNPRKYGDKQQIEVTQVHKTTEQIQREIIDLAAEFHVPIADLPANVLPFKMQEKQQEKIIDVECIESSKPIEFELLSEERKES